MIIHMRDRGEHWAKYLIEVDYYMHNALLCVLLLKCVENEEEKYCQRSGIKTVLTYGSYINNFSFGFRTFKFL